MLLGILATLISSITLGIVTWFSRKLSKFIHEFQSEHKALVESQRDQIKGQIIVIHSRAKDRGYITHTELEYINDKFPHYENLHGNTYVKALVEQCNKMEIGGDPLPVIEH